MTQGPTPEDEIRDENAQGGETPGTEGREGESLSDERNVEKTDDRSRGPSSGVGDRDIVELLNPGTERRQSMRGFDEDYTDIVDYIVRATYKIWEQKGIGRIYDHYKHNAVIHTSDGTTYGRDKVIADSTKTMAAFPDARLYADEVIWSGNDEDGFHSSHRITWVAHNTGYSIYGPPTGRKVVRRGIAHCIVKENLIVEEWIARDELALIRQLGLNEHELARKMAEKEAAGKSRGNPDDTGTIDRVEGQATPEHLPPKPGGTFDVEDFVRRSTHEIWNWRLLNKVDEYYDENYVCYTSPDRTLYGLGDFKSYILSMLAAFPDAKMSTDHVCWLHDGGDDYRTSLRWTLQGTHEGPGPYGEPTGRRVHLVGVTHHDIRDGKFVREWTCFDGFSLLKQLYKPTAPSAALDGAPR